MKTFPKSGLVFSLSASPPSKTSVSFSGWRMEILFAEPSKSPGTERASPGVSASAWTDSATFEPQILVDVSEGSKASSESQPTLLVAPIKKQLHSQQFKTAAKNTACSEKRDLF